MPVHSRARSDRKPPAARSARPAAAAWHPGVGPAEPRWSGGRGRCLPGELVFQTADDGCDAVAWPAAGPQMAADRTAGEGEALEDAAARCRFDHTSHLLLLSQLVEIGTG
ncbi:MAG: hypothetical protein ACK55I_23410, partial [bacterium]